jgi:hypothetical protein
MTGHKGGVNTYRTTSQLERWNPIPATRNRLPCIISDTKPQSHHPLHPAGTLTTIRRGVRIFTHITWIHTIWKPQNGLHMCTASTSGKGSTRTSGAVIDPSVTPPGNCADILVDVGLGFGGSVARDHAEIWWEGDLSSIDIFVVSFECRGVDFCVTVPIYIVECWCP